MLEFAPQSSLKAAIREASSTLNRWAEYYLPEAADKLASKKREAELKWAQYQALNQKLADTEEKLLAFMPIGAKILRGEVIDNLPVHTQSHLDTIAELNLKVALLNLNDNVVLNTQSDLLASYLQDLDNFQLTLDYLNALLYTNQHSLLKKVLLNPIFDKMKSKIEHVKKWKESFIQHSFNHQEAEEYLYFYLYPEDAGNPDAPAEPESLTEFKKAELTALHALKQSIQSATEVDLIELNNVYLLLMKFSSLLILSEAKSKNELNVNMMEKWAKIGLWLLEIKSSFTCNKHNRKYHSEIKEFQQLLKLIGPMVAQLYYLLAFHVTDQGQACDLDLFKAEGFLETAEDLFKKYSFTREERNSIHPVKHCILAKIALWSQDYKTFHEEIKIVSSKTSGYNFAVVKTLCLAGDTPFTNNPYPAFEYYGAALKMLEESPLIASAHFDESFIQSLREKYKTKSLALDEDLKSQIRNAFPSCRIAPRKQELEIYLPFNNLPHAKHINKFNHHAIKVVGIFNNTPSKDKIYTGISLHLNTHKQKDVLDGITSLVAMLNKELMLQEQRENRSKTTTLKKENINIPSTEERVYPRLTTSTESCITKKVKVKTRPQHSTATATVIPSTATATVIPSTATATVIPSTAKEPSCLLAKDFGFSAFANHPVTPIYSSKQAQQKQRTKVFVVFDKMDDVDEQTENLFKNALNPHPKGLVTVKPLGEAGPKMWQHPDDLQGQWNRCALRFKLIGRTAGWARSITFPQEMISVKNDEGKTENRYLFSMGRLKHK